MMRKILSGFFIFFGTLLLVVAILIVVENRTEQTEAENISMEVLEQLEPVIEAIKTAEARKDPTTAADIPDFQRNPDMEMPTTIVNGTEYVGTLEIPVLELNLPVVNTSTKANLKKSPCRYSGTPYMNNLIIGAHNYKAHFGRLKKLTYGTNVIFTDLDGNVFEYTVADIETLQPYQLDDLVGSDWPLTLYTCTVGGQSRVVVRCEKS